jgi:hypothetical protein
MKKFFLATIVFAFFFSSFQASSQISAGGGIVYATDINNIGISANGKYQINETWSAVPTFTYFFKKNGITWSALDLDANYNITEIENLGSLYALGGLNMTFFKWKYDADFGEFGDFSGSASGSDAGVNIGAGLNIAKNEKFAIAPELRYTLGGANYLRVGVKIMFGL